MTEDFAFVVRDQPDIAGKCVLAAGLAGGDSTVGLPLPLVVHPEEFYMLFQLVLEDNCGCRARMGGWQFSVGDSKEFQDVFVGLLRGQNNISFMAVLPEAGRRWRHRFSIPRNIMGVLRPAMIPSIFEHIAK